MRNLARVRILVATLFVAVAAWGQSVPASAVGGPAGGFILPAGRTAQLTNAAFSACNDLTWGYQANGSNFPQVTKSSGCFSQSAPDVTIGPFSTATTLKLFLTDNTCGATYYSDGTPVDHVIVEGSNPYTVRFADGGGFCERVNNTTNTFSGFNFEVDLKLNLCDQTSLSGPDWVGQYPADTSISDLVDPFRTNVSNFLGALNAAGANVNIQATYRLPQKAYLMHWAWMIAREGQDPTTVSAFPGPTQAQRAVPAFHGPDTLDICWTHTDQSGNPDITASVDAAEQMVEGWGIVFEPALDSEHSLGTAIDMNISWTGGIKIFDAAGNLVHIHSKPRSGMNQNLWAVGASYGVIKLPSDAPHWSVDGH